METNTRRYTVPTDSDGLERLFVRAWGVLAEVDHYRSLPGSPWAREMREKTARDPERMLREILAAFEVDLG